MTKSTSGVDSRGGLPSKSISCMTRTRVALELLDLGALALALQVFQREVGPAQDAAQQMQLIRRGRLDVQPGDDVVLAEQLAELFQRSVAQDRAVLAAQSYVDHSSAMLLLTETFWPGTFMRRR